MIDIFGFHRGRALQIRGMWKCLHYPGVMKCIYSKNYIWTREVKALIQTGQPVQPSPIV